MDSFVETMQGFIQAVVGNILSTSTPGIIDSYDSETKKARVTPAINKLFPDGTTLQNKPIDNVPVMWPRTKNAIITMPLVKGDSVLLIFAHSSLDSWLDRGGIVDPGDNRRYDQTDAIAIPGLYNFLNKSAGTGKNNDLEIAYDKASIVLKKSGDIELTNDGNKILLKTDGSIELGQSGMALVNKSFLTVFDTHTHICAAPGSPTAVPVPLSTPVNLTYKVIAQ